ncbi:MAG: hypothetical protein QOG50_2569 [Actinomycetota bacterium]|nr:hypothetical protein [Actinomycetota bacterium]
MENFAARLVVCSLASAVALAACGGSSSRTVGAADKPAATAPVVTTTTVTRAVTKTKATTERIDLSGTPGVTPVEQHRAEKLIKDTIVALHRFEFPFAAYAAGYRSIGDHVTVEHYVNWSYTNDGHILDPLRPESIVYQYRGGTQRAVAAMYQLPFGSTFANVPDVGGPLTQWHAHANLCLTDNPEQKVLSSFTTISGSCPPGTSKASNTPMLHVWIVPTPCGPFAALEGGTGQVPAGQTRRCDTRYASVP